MEAIIVRIDKIPEAKIKNENSGKIFFQSTVRLPKRLITSFIKETHDEAIEFAYKAIREKNNGFEQTPEIITKLWSLSYFYGNNELWVLNEAGQLEFLDDGCPGCRDYPLKEHWDWEVGTICEVCGFSLDPEEEDIDKPIDDAYYEKMEEEICSYSMNPYTTDIYIDPRDYIADVARYS